MLHIDVSESKLLRSFSKDMQVLFMSPLLSMGWVEGAVLVILGLLVRISLHDLVSMLSLLSLGKEIELQCLEIALGVTKPVKVALAS